MNNVKDYCWLISQQPSRKRLQTLIGPSLRLTEEGRWDTSIRLLDDFDWHVHRSGQSLIYSIPDDEPNQGRCELIKSDTPVCKQDNLSTQPVFWKDVHGGKLQQSLKKLLGYSALIPVLQVDEQRTLLACRDEEQKIQLRLELIKQTVSSQISADATQHDRVLLRILPLRGYDKEATRVAESLRRLRQKDAELLNTGELLALCKIEPEAELLPSPLPLDPREPTGVALLATARLLLQQARRYEQGVIDDTDTEYLHQYRVNVRRIRSLLSLLKQAVPDQEGRELRQGLAKLVRPTNALRDMDVFLLQQSFYADMLPQPFQPGLDALFRETEQRRQQVQQELAAYLSSEVYQQECRWLDTQLKKPADLCAPLAAVPLRQVASSKILKTYKRICKLGCGITDTTPDEQVHDLRLDCKKLRYLLDFFAALYPQEQISRHTKALKGLQTILGDFNDYAVQQAALLEQVNAQTEPDQAAAIHGLVALLYQKQLTARSQVMQALQTFAGDTLRADFKAAYSLKEKK